MITFQMLIQFFYCPCYTISIKCFFFIVSSISMNVHKRRLSFAIVDLNHVFKMRNELNVLSGVAVEIGKTKSSFNSV